MKDPNRVVVLPLVGSIMVEQVKCGVEIVQSGEDGKCERVCVPWAVIDALMAALHSYSNRRGDD